MNTSELTQTLAKVLDALRLALAELDEYHGPVIPNTGDIRPQLRRVIREAEKALEDAR